MNPLFFLLIGSVTCANILYVNPVLSPSHHIWHLTFSKGLNAKGHNVTLMEPMKSMAPPTDLYHPLQYEGSFIPIDVPELTSYSALYSFKFFMNEQLNMCKAIYKAAELDYLLKNKNNLKFDLMIIDLTVIPCALPLIQEFSNIPVIAVSPFLLPPELSHIFGNNLQPAYIPHYLLSATDEMSLTERIINFFITYISDYLIKSYRFEFEELARERFGNDLQPFSKLLRRISLLICNANPIFDYPQPVPPNIIFGGGLHARPAKPLPKDLQDILDKSKNGVIVFSLGTNVRSDKMGSEKIKILLDAFKQLKQTVLWKFESELKDLPRNVIVRTWLPQNDVIAHPNTKLFIGHGGALSTQEAFYHGVPMIGIPFFFDQHINVKTLTSRKRGLTINFDTMTTVNVLATINEILDNPIYRKNMQDVSRRFKDLPQSPLDSAVFWAEYVIKHNGTSFLDPRAREMTFMEYTCLDVILILFIVCILFLLFLWKFIKFVHRVYKKIIDKKKVD